MKTGVSASKKAFQRVFAVFIGSQAILFSVFSLGLISSFLALKKSENSEKSNYMLSDTLHIELVLLPTFGTCQIYKTI